jgi:hypothetical protein
MVTCQVSDFLAWTLARLPRPLDNLNRRAMKKRSSLFLKSENYSEKVLLCWPLTDNHCRRSSGSAIKTFTVVDNDAVR